MIEIYSKVPEYVIYLWLKFTVQFPHNVIYLCLKLQ